MASLVRGESFAAVLTSPSGRARDTASLAGYGDAEVVDDLREWDYGDYEGRTTADIRNEMPGWTIWNGPWRGGETVVEIGARMDRVVARVRRAGGDVLLFSHGHALRVLAARWLGLPPAAGAGFALGTGSLSELGFERETPVIERWNLRLGT